MQGCSGVESVPGLLRNQFQQLTTSTSLSLSWMVVEWMSYVYASPSLSYDLYRGARCAVKAQSDFPPMATRSGLRLYILTSAAYSCKYASYLSLWVCEAFSEKNVERLSLLSQRLSLKLTKRQISVTSTYRSASTTPVLSQLMDARPYSLQVAHESCHQCPIHHYLPSHPLIDIRIV